MEQGCAEQLDKLHARPNQMRTYNGWLEGFGNRLQETGFISIIMRDIRVLIFSLESPC